MEVYCLPYIYSHIHETKSIIFRELHSETISNDYHEAYFIRYLLTTIIFPLLV